MKKFTYTLLLALPFISHAQSGIDYGSNGGMALDEILSLASQYAPVGVPVIVLAVIFAAVRIYRNSRRPQ